MGGYATSNTVRRASTYSSDDELPVGVGILAIIMGVLGFLAMLAGILLVAEATGLSIGALGAIVGIINQYVITVGQFGGVLLVLGGVVTLAIAAGLWHQESWALWTCIVGVAIVEAILFFLLVPFSYLFIGLLVLYVYLLAVRHHFR